MDPDQTAPIGAVCSGSTLFASILNLSVMLGNYLQQTTSADDFSGGHFQMHFFLGALRVNLEMFSCHPLICILNHPNYIVLNQIEESKVFLLGDPHKPTYLKLSNKLQIWVIENDISGFNFLKGSH